MTTEASFRVRPDGRWFVTGDRAHRDADGRYCFDGRRSDVLKVAGENVSTVEVEQVLSAHSPGARSRGRRPPDEIRDEVPVAFVVADDRASRRPSTSSHEWCARTADEVETPP